MTSISKYKEKISFLPGDWIIPLAFLLSMSMLGLEFPFAYLFITCVMAYSFFKNRYDFLIQCTLLFGVFGFYDENVSFPFKLADVALIISIIGAFILRKDKLLWKLLLACLAYICILFLIASMSAESMIIQIRRLRQYLHILYFIFPLLVFANRDFNIMCLFKRLFLYASVIAIFYVLDSLVFCEHIFMPRTTWGTLTYETLTIDIFDKFERIYPPGLYITALLLFPLLFIYKLPVKYWIILSMGLICTKTLSVICGLIITWILFYGSLRNKLKNLFIVFCLFVVGAIIDTNIGGQLRIAQFIDQFVTIANAGSVEDLVSDNIEELAEFGTGRGAQIIPKLEVLTSTKKQLFGFGFLHDKLTTNDDYIIHNEFYSDQSSAEEVTSFVEVSQIQTILDIGIIGLLLQSLFYFYLYWLIRKCKYKNFYFSTLICISLFGIGGFAGLNQPHGLLLLGLSLGCIVLNDKKEKQYEAVHNYSGL